MKNRIIIVGDVHGCLIALERLMEEVEWDPDNDELGFVGDLVDRGPSSVEVVRWVRHSGAWCLKGNHEDKYVRLRRRGRMILNENARQLNGQLSDEDVDWMERLPLFREFHPGWLAVHAGFEPYSVDLQRHSEVVMHIREWEQDWNQDYNVVYGHTARRTPAVFKNERGKSTIGIDTACCYGYALTAFVFNPANETYRFRSVPNPESYSDWYGELPP